MPRHINLFFAANVMTVLHNRNFVAWIVAGIGVWYIDIAVRIFSKLKKASLKSVEMHGDNLCKLVIAVEGFPRDAFVMEPGSYV